MCVGTEALRLKRECEARSRSQRRTRDGDLSCDSPDNGNCDVEHAHLVHESCPTLAQCTITNRVRRLDGSCHATCLLSSTSTVFREMFEGGPLVRESVTTRNNVLADTDGQCKHPTEVCDADEGFDNMMNVCTTVTMESQAGQCTVIGKGVQFNNAGCIDRPTECASGSIFANRVSFDIDGEGGNETVTGKGCVSAAGVCRFGHVGFEGRCAPAAEVCAAAEGYNDAMAACVSTPTAAQCDALGRLIQGTGCITQAAECGDAADEFIAAHISTCVSATQCPMQDNSAILNGRCVSTANPDNCLAIGRYLDGSGDCVVPTTTARLPTR